MSLLIGVLKISLVDAVMFLILKAWLIINVILRVHLPVKFYRLDFRWLREVP